MERHSQVRGRGDVLEHTAGEVELRSVAKAIEATLPRGTGLPRHSMVLSSAICIAFRSNSTGAPWARALSPGDKEATNGMAVAARPAPLITAVAATHRQRPRSEGSITGMVRSGFMR